MFYKEDLHKYLKELSYLEFFKGQLYLEEEIMKGFQKDLLTLQIEDPSFQLKYARLQGQVDALKTLSSTRNLITNSESKTSPLTKEQKNVR